MTDSPLVSVIIRTRDSEEGLRTLVHDLRQQRHIRTEVIIVDHGSRDLTRSVADQFECRWVDYPDSESFNYSKAINIGNQHGTGDYVLVCSPHVRVLFPDTVSTMIEVLESLNLIGVYCETTRLASQPSSEGVPRCETISWDNYDGGNAMRNYFALYRRKILLETGGFDESLPSCEDQKWALDRYAETGSRSGRLISHPVLYSNPYMSFQKMRRDYFVIFSIVNRAHGVGCSAPHQLRVAWRYLVRREFRKGSAMIAAMLMSLFPQFFLARQESRYY